MYDIVLYVRAYRESFRKIVLMLGRKTLLLLFCAVVCHNLVGRFSLVLFEISLYSNQRAVLRVSKTAEEMW